MLSLATRPEGWCVTVLQLVMDHFRYNSLHFYYSDAVTLLSLDTAADQSYTDLLLSSHITQYFNG